MEDWENSKIKLEMQNYNLIWGYPSSVGVVKELHQNLQLEKMSRIRNSGQESDLIPTSGYKA